MRRVLSLSAVILLLWAGLALAATQVYYSVCPFGTGDIKTGSPTITISSGVATLSVAQTGNIGQGCRITYNGTSVCYISQVNSSTSFNVVTATGGTPGDVSGQTVNSIAHEYASLSDAEAGASDANHTNNADLTAIDVILNLCCYYDHDDQTADTAPCTIDGYTADATRYINIYTPTGGTQSINNQRHAGKWSTSKYRMSGAIPLTLSDPYVRVSGLQIISTGTSYRDSCIFLTDVGSTDERRIFGNILRQETAADDTHGIYGYWVSGTVYIFNNLIYDFSSSSGIYGNNVGAYAIYNNTIINCSFGIYQVWPETSSVKNNILRSCSTPISGTFASGSGYNATDAESLGYTVTGGATSDRVSQTFTFADEANDDFSLASNDAGARDYGVSDPGSGLYSDDIIGNTRSGSWDIGAFEYVVKWNGITPAKWNGVDWSNLKWNGM